MDRKKSASIPLLTRGDFDAGIGIFFDGFTKILVALGVWSVSLSLPADVVFRGVMPAVFLTILLSNGGIWLYYRLQRRADLVAIPAGIQSFRVFVWLFSIIVPTFNSTSDPLLALQVGVVAHLLSGLIFIAGIYLMPYILKLIPDAALFGSIAGGAMAFMILQSLDSVLSQPLIGLLAMGIIFVSYFADWRPQLPAALIAMLVGVILNVFSGEIVWSKLSEAEIGFFLPRLQRAVLDKDVWVYVLKFLPLIIVFSLDEVITGLQAVAQATLCGDDHDAKKPLLICGIADVVGSLFGNPLAVGLYWGYPAWKKVGARTGYHLIAIVAYGLISMTGIGSYVVEIIPLASVLPLLIFVGISSFSQAFSTFDQKYYPALTLALVPLLINFIGNNASLDNLSGLSKLGYGAPMLALLIASAMIYLIDRQWLRLALISLFALLLSLVGVLHSPGLIGTADFHLAKDFVMIYIIGFGWSMLQYLRK